VRFESTIAVQGERKWTNVDGTFSERSLKSGGCGRRERESLSGIDHMKHIVSE
jgi:hypothetical protein